MISCRDWWPWTKPDYITTTRRQSSNQWNGGIAAHPGTKISECKNSLKKFSPRLFGGDQDGILLIDYLPKDQTVNAEYYSSLLVQLKDIFKEKPAGRSPRGSCSCTTKPRVTGHLQPRRNWPTWASSVFITHPIHGSDPVALPPVPWTEKAIEMSSFFVRLGGHWCCGDLVGRTTFWIFFWSACKGYLTGLRSVLRFVEGVLSTSWVWSL